MRCFLRGYFIFCESNDQCADVIDMRGNRLFYVQVISCFGLSLLTDRYHGYSVISLLLEVNSVFLHMRQLVLLSGNDKDGLFYRINGVINLGKTEKVRLI